MANLAKNDAQWLRFAGSEHGIWLCAIRVAAEMVDKFSRERTQVVIVGDLPSPRIASITLTGVVYGVNTSKDGLLYVRLTASGGDWIVLLYTAPSASGLVATATGVADPGTGNFVADNGSGITGTVTLLAGVAAETTDRLYLRIDQDFPARAPNVWNQDGSSDDDTYSLKIAQGAFDQVAELAEQQLAVILAAYGTWLNGDEKNEGRGNDFLAAAESLLFRESFETRSGTVTVSTVGILERMRICMNDELTGSEQTVLERVVSDAAATFGSNNWGAGSFSAFTPGENCPAGRIVGTCVAGADTQNVAAQRFAMVLVVDQGGDERRIPMPDLYVGRSYAGPFGLAFTLSNTYAKSGDDGDGTDVAAASLAVVTGATSQNTDNGLLYVHVDEAAGVSDYLFYKSAAGRASADTGELVASVTGVADDAAFTAQPYGASGLTVVWKSGTAPADNDEFVLDLKPFKKQNTALEADTFEIVLSESATAGLIARTHARHTGGKLNSTSGTPTISDAYAKAGVGFGPYAVTDN